MPEFHGSAEFRVFFKIVSGHSCDSSKSEEKILCVLGGGGQIFSQLDFYV